MSIPKGAIKTFDEFREVLAAKPKQIYICPKFIKSEGRDLEGVIPINILVKTKLEEGYLRPIEGDGGGFTQVGLTYNEPPRTKQSESFFFANYWHAYAYSLRCKNDRT